jgi:hypothetical protein
MVGQPRSYGGIVTDRAIDDAGSHRLLGKGGLRAWSGCCRGWCCKHHRAAWSREPEFDVRTAKCRQIDGGNFETPLRFAVAPRALRVVVPKGLTSALFSSGNR